MTQTELITKIEQLIQDKTILSDQKINISNSDAFPLSVLVFLVYKQRDKTIMDQVIGVDPDYERWIGIMNDNQIFAVLSSENNKDKYEWKMIEIEDMVDIIKLSWEELVQ